MITVKHICKSYGVSNVLSDISFSLTTGQKAALVGANAVGKSTLLKIIAGIEKPDSGTIELPSNTCIGYLPQEIDISQNNTIERYLKRVSGLEELEEKMQKLESNLTDPKKLDEYSNLQNLYVHLDGYAFEHRMKMILKGFELTDITPSTSLKHLSGGQKNKVALAGILLKGVDILLLDEPTNNLDLPALIWLENFLLKSKATCLIVSHDRRFLDKVASKVFEIEWYSRQIITYTGSYTNYLEVKEKQLQEQKKLYSLQQEEIKRLKETARQKKEWAKSGANQDVSDHDKYSRGVRRDRAAKSSKAAKTVEKRLEQMEKIEKPQERLPLTIPLRAQKNETKSCIRLKEVVAGYKDGFKTEPINLEIEYGSRIGILGINGSGKSTLLKTITGELKPIKGEVIRSPSIIFGNLMQEHENLPRDFSLFQFLKDKAQLNNEQTYSLLRHFNFSLNETKKKIGKLSPGGRARLLLSYFAAIGSNILVLDEPSNHLDLEAIEALKETLKTYTGTVILVSHDRYFIEQAELTCLYVLEKNKLKFVPSYQDYLTKITNEVKLKLNQLFKDTKQKFPEERLRVPR